MRNVALLTGILCLSGVVGLQQTPTIKAANEKHLYLDSPSVWSVLPSNVIVANDGLQVRQQMVCDGNTCRMVNVPVSNVSYTSVPVNTTPVFSNVQSTQSNVFYSPRGTRLLRGQPLRNFGRRLFGRRCNCQ